MSTRLREFREGDHRNEQSSEVRVCYVGMGTPQRPPQTNKQSSEVQGEGHQPDEHEAQGAGPSREYSMSLGLREQSDVDHPNEQSSEVRSVKRTHGIKPRGLLDR